MQNARRKLPAGWHVVGPTGIDYSLPGSFPPPFPDSTEDCKQFLDAAQGVGRVRGARRAWRASASALLYQTMCFPPPFPQRLLCTFRPQTLHTAAAAVAGCAVD